ncbi:hypothetical protein EMIT0P74_100101 [Pseudomonas sp. IT-P74]
MIPGGLWPKQSGNLIALTIARHPAQSEYFPVDYGSPNLIRNTEGFWQCALTCLLLLGSIISTPSMPRSRAT